MRTNWTSLVGLMLLAALLLQPATGSRAASLEEELSWIGATPGLTLVNSTAKSHKVSNDYTIQGNPDSVFASVKSAAQQRGWAVRDSSKTAYGGASTRVFTATKGDRRLRVSVNQAAGWTALHAELRAGSAGQSDAPGQNPQSPHGRNTGGVIDVSANESVTVNDSGLNVTYRMAGNQLTVNGSSNRIVVTGSCTAVTVNGSSNVVDVQGQVRAITTNGASNTVTWSRARNAHAPAVQDNVGTNRISGK